MWLSGSMYELVPTRAVPAPPRAPHHSAHPTAMHSLASRFKRLHCFFALVHRYSRQFKVPRSTVVFKPADASAAANAYFHTNNWDKVISNTAREDRGVPEFWIHRRVLFTTRQVLLHPPLMACLRSCQQYASIRCRQEETAVPRAVYRNLWWTIETPLGVNFVSVRFHNAILESSCQLRGGALDLIGWTAMTFKMLTTLK